MGVSYLSNHESLELRTGAPDVPRWSSGPRLRVSPGRVSKSVSGGPGEGRFARCRAPGILGAAGEAPALSAGSSFSNRPAS